MILCPKKKSIFLLFKKIQICLFIFWNQKSFLRSKIKNCHSKTSFWGRQVEIKIQGWKARSLLLIQSTWNFDQRTPMSNCDEFSRNSLNSPTTFWALVCSDKISCRKYYFRCCDLTTGLKNPLGMWEEAMHNEVKSLLKEHSHISSSVSCNYQILAISPSCWRTCSSGQCFCSAQLGLEHFTFHSKKDST